MLTKYLIGQTKTYGQSLFAARPIKAGETIFVIAGPITKKPSIYTVPVDYNLYIDPLEPGRLLNHSCEPSCGIKNRTEVVAMRDLTTGDEITIDYAMVVHHYDPTLLTQDITCQCKKSSCRSSFGSFSTLSAALKEKYAGYISDYLLH